MPLEKRALYLLSRIKEDLDPMNFTVREIVDEGFTVRDTYDQPTDKANVKWVRNMLAWLIREGHVEEVDHTSKGKVFALTDPVW